MIRIAFTLLLASSILPAWSQGGYHYRADIQKIDSSGVYKVELKPEFLSKSTSKGLYDIRMVDERGKFVAYTIISNPTDKLKPAFIDFPEVKQNSDNDSATYYIAENKDKIKISQLWLKLKNTAVNRLTDISGSDDLQHWFAIKENIQLQDAGANENADYEQMLSFPTSDYRYLKIRISNKNKDFVKITRSGVYLDNTAGNIHYVQLPPIKLTSKTANKQTSYYADLGGKYVINSLKMDISSPQYYTRHITIYDEGNKTDEMLYDDSISSGSHKEVSFSAKTDKLRIDIANGDDNPLVIKSISVFQLQNFAVSYLEKEHTYYVLTGDTAANEVSYDLSFVHSKPLSEFPVIAHSAVYKNPAYAMPNVGKKKSFTLLLWVAIGTVLILLSLLTWKMVKEISARQTSE
ncbi:MAG: DUF3999 family protein [Mucilaginibacter sp.]|nr:DUF3999 family protein [Mucilaginibacter sp.]